MHRFSGSSLRAQFLLIALVAILPILGLILYAGIEQRREAELQVQRDVQQLTVLGASNLGQTVQAASQMLYTLSQIDSVQNYNTQACSSLFSKLVQKNPLFINLVAAQPNGDVYCSAIPTSSPVNIADRPYFQRVVTQRSFSLGDYQVGRITNQPDLVFAYPVMDPTGYLRAVLAAGLSLASLDQTKLLGHLGTGSSVLVLDSNGAVLSRSPSNTAIVGKNFPEERLTKAILRQKSGTTDLPGLDGIHRIYAFAPVDNTGQKLFIAVGIPLNDALSAPNAALTRNLIGLGLVSLFALLAIWNLGEAVFLRPIHLLSTATRRLGLGDMSARIEGRIRPTELNQLATSFNEMAASLETSTVKIQRAERNFRTLVEQIPAVTYRSIPDESNSHRYVSPQSQSILGYPPQAWLDEPDFWIEHIYPGDRERVAHEWAAFRAGGQEWRSLYRMVSSTNQEVWFRDEAVRVHDDPDEPDLLQGVMLDITEREEIWESLRRERDLMERIMETSPAGILVLDENSRITYSNAQAESLLRLPKGQPAELSLEDLLPSITDLSGQPIPMQALPFSQVMNEGMPVYDFNLRYIPAGSDRLNYVSINSSPLIDAAGKISGVVATLQDITSRVQAQQDRERQQQDYRVIFNSVPGMIWYLDADNRVIRANQAASDVTGQPLSSLIGKRFREIFPAQDGLGELENQEVMRTGQPILGKLAAYPKAGGERGWAMVDRLPYLGKEGSAAGVIVILNDVTERRQRERELEALGSVASALRNAITRTEMLPIVLNQVLSLTEAEGALFAHRDPATKEILLEQAVGAWTPARGRRMPSQTGISSRVYETSQPYLTNHAPGDPILVRSYFIGNLESAACVPLISHHQTIGLLWIGKSTEITQNDMRVLTAIADISASAVYRASLFEQTQLRLQRLMGLHAIDMAITASLDERVTMSMLLDQVTSQLHVDAADVLLLRPELQSLEFIGGRGFTTSRFQNVSLQLGEGYAGRAAVERRVLSIPDLVKAEEPTARVILQAGESFKAYFAAPLVAKGQVKGVLEIFHRSVLHPDPEWYDFLETLATQAAIAVDNADLFDRLQRSNDELTLAYDATIEGWSHALELRDHETQGHSRRVTELSLRLARIMNISDPDLSQFRRGVLLHDIGKMAIPDSILLKPGPLTSEEWQVMRQHPMYAYDLLSPIPYLRNALEVPYSHHERWNGKGYPRGLRGEQIPLVARIFSVVDVWDALTSDRPYRKAWPADKARDYICSRAGSDFDPQVVDAFIKLKFGSKKGPAC